MSAEPLVLIPAGGSGTRLWPASRSARPKFLVDLGIGEPLLLDAVRRGLCMTRPEQIQIITGAMHLDEIRGLCNPLGIKSYICEPTPRDTGAAIAVGTMIAAEADPDVIVVSMPADHIVRGDDEWRDTMGSAVDATSGGHLVTIGIPPREPDTSLGYIYASANDASTRYRQVTEFREKPDVDSARRYVASSDYFWNAGIFVWRAASFVEALHEHAPELANRAADVVQLWKKHGSIDEKTWARVPRISIDYALCEPSAKEGQMRMVPATFDWWDLGTWASVASFTAQSDGRGRTKEGLVARFQSDNCFVHQAAGTTRRIALFGVDDLVVVDAEDVLLVADKAAVADSKDLVGFLRSQGWDGSL